MNVPDSGVETNDSDCSSLTSLPGAGAEFTLYNAQLYEGIPALNFFGMALLALIVPGVDLVGFRHLG